MSRKNERMRRYRLGIWAEYLALVYLLCLGYRPLQRRLKTPLGEIDLVMRGRDTLIFVEVKARRSLADAAYAVHAKNQARVVRAAHWFLATHPNYAQGNIRFDVVLVAWYRWPHHIPHAFS